MNLRLCVLSSCFLAVSAFADSDLALWYETPARYAMTEALPIGNGRLGALVFGTPEKERLCVNQSSLWTGDENPSGNYDTMGAYQALGDLFVELAGQTNVTNYRRELDVGQAVVRVRYQAKGIKYSREFFASQPAGVLVAWFGADKTRSLSGRIIVTDAHHAGNSVSADRIRASGTLRNGLNYEWTALVIPQDGTLTDDGSALIITNCSSLTLLIAAETDYAMDYAAHYRGAPPHSRLEAQLTAAKRQTYSALLAAHLNDFQSLFSRVALDLGTSSSAQRALPTDQRKSQAATAFDPGLEQLLFQYGRYLLVSCSRPGGLPANLQGLWNDSNDPPWHSDYHANINVQMNYWPAEVANLSECHLPFLNLVQSQLPAWRQAAAASDELRTPNRAMTARGFALRTSHNTTGGLGWKWDKTANAWYCLHFWEHYAFTMDKTYLRQVAYPVLKETCQFWEDHLKRLPGGRLVVPNAWSPEHGPDEDGVSYSQEIVWDLFNNYVQASDALQTDKAYRDRIAAIRDQLVTPGIGTWGQLLEWMTEKRGTNAVSGSPELDTPRDHHRHTSHLFAVYPGSQFVTGRTPGLAAAAKVSLDARGVAPDSDVREWSFAWRSALYARLHDGDSAHQMLQQLFSRRNTCPNLFGQHPPPQLDGNFGITAGVCEMLLQSQGDEIELLPALPTAWSQGSVKGLCARGGFVVDLSWSNRKLTSATFDSRAGRECKIRYGSKVTSLTIAPGKSQRLTGAH